MADITIGFKGSTEFKEKIDTMVHASGMDKKEWIQHLVSIYELQHMKEQEGLRKYLGDLESLEEHTVRINEIFSSLIKKAMDEQKKYAMEMANLEKERNTTIEMLTVQVEEFKQVASQKDDELKIISEKLTETHKHLIRLEELAELHKTIIAEKHKEIDRLSDANNNLKTKPNDEQVKLLKNENILLSKQFEMLKVQHEADRSKLESELTDKYAEELKSLINASPNKKKRGRPKKNPGKEDTEGLEADQDNE